MLYVVFPHYLPQRTCEFTSYVILLCSDVHFDPKAYIDSDWQLVGNGHAGRTKLNYIKEEEEGPTNKQYVGAIFDDSSSASVYVQNEIAASTIEATISATSAVPPPEFSPDFDKTEALRYAQLSQLAYPIRAA